MLVERIANIPWPIKPPRIYFDNRQTFDSLPKASRA
jgi:hypothetical protein